MTLTVRTTEFEVRVQARERVSISRARFQTRNSSQNLRAGPGLGLGLGLQWQLNREHRIAFWYSRTIDRVVDGVIWQPTRYAALHRPRRVLRQPGSGRRTGWRRPSALKMTGEGPAPTIVGNEFLGLFRSAARLKHPTFSVSADSHAGSGGWPNQWIVTLEDARQAGPSSANESGRRPRMGTANCRRLYALNASPFRHARRLHDHAVCRQSAGGGAGLRGPGRRGDAADRARVQPVGNRLRVSAGRSRSRGRRCASSRPRTNSPSPDIRPWARPCCSRAWMARSPARSSSKNRLVRFAAAPRRRCRQGRPGIVRHSAVAREGIRSAHRHSHGRRARIETGRRQTG